MIDPFTLPFVPYSDRHALPEIQAVYFVVRFDAVLYIGQSQNLYRRFVAHNKRKLFAVLNVERIAWLDGGTLEDETRLIREFKPCLNNRDNPNRYLDITLAKLDVKKHETDKIILVTLWPYLPQETITALSNFAAQHIPLSTGDFT